MRITKRRNWNFGKEEGWGGGGGGVGKDHGVGLGTIRNGEQLSQRPGGKSEVEEDGQVGSTGGRKKEQMSGDEQ